METKKNRKIKIALAGAGLIGKERIVAINNLIQRGFEIDFIGVFDPLIKNKNDLTNKYKIKFLDSEEDLFKHSPDWLFIAIPHDDAVSLCIKGLKNNVNVLIEKPLGRNLKEAQEIYSNIKRDNQLYVGFNYRFYDGVKSLIKHIDEGKFGNLISINMILGHGCNPDITKSWKLDPVKAGGGCLIDPGIHFIDLCRIFSNDNIKSCKGYFWDGFWKTGIEEECNIMFDCNKFIVNMQISIVKWRSTFRIEVNGDEGYGIINGRNRSYGIQKYYFGKRWGWQSGKSQIESEELIVEDNGEDVFIKETQNLLYPENENSVHVCNSLEALRNMEIFEMIKSNISLK
jgi:predicted dehydrogenase